MCVIIDNNTVHSVLVSDDGELYGKVKDAISSGRHRLVVAGHLRREYNKNLQVKRRLSLLERAGQAILMPDGPVDALTRTISEEGRLSSDDPHIIALARVHHVRLLCSNDKDLATDFGNPKILKPRGKVYRVREIRPGEFVVPDGPRALTEQRCRRCCKAGSGKSR